MATTLSRQMIYYYEHKDEISQKKKLYYQSLPIEERQRRSASVPYTPSKIIKKSGVRIPEDMRSPQLKYYYQKKGKLISS